MVWRGNSINQQIIVYWEEETQTWRLVQNLSKSAEKLTELWALEDKNKMFKPKQDGLYFVIWFLPCLVFQTRRFSLLTRALPYLFPQNQKNFIKKSIPETSLVPAAFSR